MTYDSPIETELIIKELCNLKQQFTQYGGARPFGVSLMIAGKTNNKFQIYSSDVTGNYLEYYATAIGENDDKIKEKLREEYKKDLTIKRGLKIALDIFREIQGEKFKINKFEACYISKEQNKITRIEGSEIENIK